MDSLEIQSNDYIDWLASMIQENFRFRVRFRLM